MPVSSRAPWARSPGNRTRGVLCKEGSDFVRGVLVTPCALQLCNFVTFSLLQAVKEEGQDPEEMGVMLEATSKKTVKRCVKGIGLCLSLPEA